MNTKRLFFAFFCIFLFVLFPASIIYPRPADTGEEIVSDISERVSKLPSTVIDYDRSLLDDNEKKVVEKLIEASRYIDQIFWRMVSEKNPELRAELLKKAESDKVYGKALAYFDMMKGRWDRIHHDEPFLAPFGEAGKKPKGAAFYPVDMPAEEFEKWVKENPEDKQKLEDLFTVVRRKEGKLTAIPYSVYYAEYLKPASEKLREAAALAKNESLRNYLNKRADAFLNDDYYESDIAWMDLDSPIEIVIGPYEVYEDSLFNFKAAFESFVTVVDKEESKKLDVFAKHLPDMEKNLPIPDEHKNPNRGTDSPIKVVQEIFTAGDARNGVQTAAFNLPNDERVREEKGSKKVMLKNVMEAKFQKTGEPIVKRIMDESQLSLLSFDAYFTHTLLHELSHGLGPGIISGPDGNKVESRLLLKNLYSAIEEAKADAVGAWVGFYAMEKGILTSFDDKTFMFSYAALIFRLMRHGIGEAHGKANAVQWNWLRESGAIVPSGDRFKVDFEKMREGIRSLSNELLMIEATGDYARAEKLLTKYGTSNSEIESVTARLKDLPIDITPVFTAAGEK